MKNDLEPKKHDPGLPEFVTQATTQSFKETFNTAVLLWVNRQRHPPPRPTRRRAVALTAALLTGVVYLTLHHDQFQLLTQYLP
jgi:hypothetical protein